MGRKKGRFLPTVAAIVILTGILVLLYPLISNFLARRQQENVIVGYEEIILQMDKEVIDEEWEKARAYNRDRENYEEVLNIEGNGVMGYIEIPKIDVRLPIYHYANEKSLKKGVGHMEQTGLPIGGENNHPVLTGHRGLPNAELFTRLDEMETGDCFFIHMLDRVLIYEVCRITVVMPEEIGRIKAEKNQDLITLVTCTPYGVNTHRLLVTGIRTEFEEESYEEREVKMPGRNKIIFYIIIIFTGVVVLVFPHLTDNIYSQKTERQKRLYFHHISSLENEMEDLYMELSKRNKELYLTEQKNFTSADAYGISTIDLKRYGIYHNTIGYICIPKMGIELPVLLGASEENMRKGAVHLTETSYPIGGRNTNCVIAAHRGYSKTAMFREIEKLKAGDKVYIENFRERLVYEVVETRIILPTDIGQVLIRDGKDMLTLMTCHPYRKNLKRYVVFCERI